MTTTPIILIVVSVALALIPLLIGTLTSYLKVNIVLSVLRNGFATQQIPGPLVTMVLSLALTGFIMGPLLHRTMDIIATHHITEVASKGDLAALSGSVPAMWEPWQEFLSAHTGEKELRALARLQARQGRGSAPQASTEATSSPIVTPSTEELRKNPTLLLPAFILSELKSGFAMGALLLVPFLVIDLLVANILVGLGMTLVNPSLISLPLKLALFVSADGWLLVSRGLILSYTGVGS